MSRHIVAGGDNFGVAGDNPLTDEDGDGIYSVSFCSRAADGGASDYTILNGNCPGGLLRQ